MSDIHYISCVEYATNRLLQADQIADQLQRIPLEDLSRIDLMYGNGKITAAMAIMNIAERLKTAAEAYEQLAGAVHAHWSEW